MPPKPFRVLDIGCHDGFVAAHVIRQIDQPVHIDGLDLNEQAVSVFTRRVREAGATGEARYGRAEDAARLFPEQSYDAVVLYEVIEHAPDVNALLDAVERMVKPGGRVYVSTPDGTFGTGGNPYHLHCWSAGALADLMRRRGRLQDMAVGEDGITVCSYRPDARQGTMTIFTPPGWEPWSPMDMERRGLGGSETAACRVAEAMAERGWIVTVYGDCEPCAWRDVIFRPGREFDPLAPVDLLLVSRAPEVFDRPHRAKRAMLWMHDVDYGDRVGAMIGCDDVLTLSVWHEAHVKGRYPHLAGRVRRIRNGLDLARFEARDWERSRRVLYTSSPDRGLDVLLELWPRVREQVPDAVLAACYSPVYQRVADLSPEIGAFRAKVETLADQPGVELLLAQSQPGLAKLMLSSMVWAHPSFCTPAGAPFHETSCIGAMEAQAAGLHVVASNWGALTETVRVGALVDGEPLSERWRDGMVAEIVRGLTDPATQERAQTVGPAHMAHRGWDGVAREIEANATAAAPVAVTG